MKDQKPDLMELISSKMKRMSKGQKLIGEYILNQYDKAAFMTASKLGNAVGTSESTVVRFAIALGFEGYPELSRSLQDIVKTKLTAVQRLELTSDLVEDENTLKGVMKGDIENIRDTLENIDYPDFEKFTDEIFNADKVYILGLRSSTALSEFLGFYLNLILNKVQVLNHGMSDIYEQLLNIGGNDLLIGIGFPRYSIKTVEVMRFAKKRNAKVMCLTDSEHSPLTEFSDVTLYAKSNMASFVDSLVAPMSLINAIIVSIGLKKKDKVTETFRTLEKIWEENRIFVQKNYDRT